MMELTSPKTIRYIMEKYGFSFSKGLGQNFIVDGRVLERIADGAEITSEDCVLEIGPGIGVMTNVLCERAKKVVAVEIDKRLIPILNETVGHHDKLTVINADILKLDLKALMAAHFEGERVKLVANLPYYVTTPIIMSFLEERLPIDALVIMIQKEVGERIMAPPGSKTYGALSVAVQYFSEPSIVTKVSRGAFMPIPTVDSVVLNLAVRKESPVKLLDESLFFAVVKDGFGKRRKTLLNALSSGRLGLSKPEAEQVLIQAGVSPSARAETLDMNQFATLANAVFKLKQA